MAKIIFCEMCDEQVESKEDLAVAGTKQINAYHMECYRQWRQAKYGPQMLKNKYFPPINNGKYFRGYVLFYLGLWIFYVSIHFGMGIDEFLLRLCESRPGVVKCSLEEMEPHPVAMLFLLPLAMYFTLLLHWPFIKRLFSWFLYERHLKKIKS